MSAFQIQANLPTPVRPSHAADSRVLPRTIVDLPGGRKIAYAETGVGPDLVAIHGTLMTLEDLWLGPVPALARHFRVVAVDRPGHGYSERRRIMDASLWRQVGLIREAVLELGLKRPVLLGHSYGAALAIAYGMLHPEEVRGVVALAPPCFPEPRLEQAFFGPRAVPVAGEALSETLSLTTDPAMLRALWAATFAPQLMPADYAANFPFELVRRPAQLVAEGEDANALGIDLVRSALSYPDCRVPVRILGGGSDRVVNSFAHGRMAAWMIPGAQFDWLPGLGHMLHHVATDAVVEAARAVAHPN